MDVTSLKPGQDFRDLKPGYVIFICTFDPFGRGLYRYTFEQRCLEQNFPLGDETKKIFLNTKGKNADDVPEELVHFLHYVENTTDIFVQKVQDKQIEKLHDRIFRLKKSREWEARYMTLEEYMKQSQKAAVEESRVQGRNEGIQEGQARLLKLISSMAGHGEADLIPRLEQDSAFLNAMYQKYNL